LILVGIKAGDPKEPPLNPDVPTTTFYQWMHESIPSSAVPPQSRNVSVWSDTSLLVSDVWIFYRVDTRERKQLAEMIKKLNQESQEPVVP
jgi:hypothetical protein